MEEAAKLPDIVEIAISTRPDCIREDYLDMMEEIAAAYNISIGIELGLQTANYHTLKDIRRGHGLAEYLDACLRIQKRDFLLCTHVILNLPGDTLDDVIETGKIISIMGNHLVKAHSLYIARETEMAHLFENGRLTIGSKEDYFLRLQTFLEYLSPDIAVERLFSRIPEEDALFSNWQTSWWKLQDEFLAHMEAHKSFQGKRYDYMNGPSLKIFDGR